MIGLPNQDELIAVLLNNHGAASFAAGPRDGACLGKASASATRMAKHNIEYEAIMLLR
jgi:hypothetical protein